MSTDHSSLLTRRSLLAGSAALVGSSLVTPAYAAPGLVVIVHAGNQETPSLADLAAMFTTRKQTWSGGKRIVPFNFPPKHEVRVAFDRAVLEMDPDAVARYWIDRRIRGGNPPPKQVTNARMIVRLVEKLDGAIAYVPRDTQLGATRVVREL